MLGTLKKLVGPPLVHKPRHAGQEAVHVMVDVPGFVLLSLGCRPGLQRNLSVRRVDHQAFSRPGRKLTASAADSKPRGVVPGHFEVFFGLRPVTPVAAEVRCAVGGPRGIERRCLLLGTSPEHRRVVGCARCSGSDACGRRGGRAGSRPATPGRRPLVVAAPTRAAAAAPATLNMMKRLLISRLPRHRSRPPAPAPASASPSILRDADGPKNRPIRRRMKSFLLSSGPKTC